MPNPGDRVAIHYTGTLDNGTEFDSSRGGDPLEFEMGAEQVIPGFEKAVGGLSIGETSTFRLEPGNAYGEVRDDLLFDVPQANAPDGLSAGDMVQLSTGQPATVLEVTEETVKIDANHPLAGQALTFEVELVSVASEGNSQ